jgi:hypothetical protein
MPRLSTWVSCSNRIHFDADCLELLFMEESLHERDHHNSACIQ